MSFAEFVLNPHNLYHHLIDLSQKPECLLAGIDLLKAFLTRVIREESHSSSQKKVEIQRCYSNLALMVTIVLEIGFDEIETRCHTEIIKFLVEGMRGSSKSLVIPNNSSELVDFDLSVRLHCYIVYVLGQGGGINFGAETKAVEERTVSNLSKLLALLNEPPNPSSSNPSKNSNQLQLTSLTQSPGYTLKYIILIELGLFYCYRAQYDLAATHLKQAFQHFHSNLPAKTCPMPPDPSLYPTHGYRARFHPSRLSSYLSLITQMLSPTSLLQTQTLPAEKAHLAGNKISKVYNLMIQFISQPLNEKASGGNGDERVDLAGLGDWRLEDVATGTNDPDNPASRIRSEIAEIVDILLDDTIQTMIPTSLPSVHSLQNSTETHVDHVASMSDSHRHSLIHMLSHDPCLSSSAAASSSASSSSSPSLASQSQPNPSKMSLVLSQRRKDLIIKLVHGSNIIHQSSQDSSPTLNEVLSPLSALSHAYPELLTHQKSSETSRTEAPSHSNVNNSCYHPNSLLTLLTSLTRRLQTRLQTRLRPSSLAKDPAAAKVARVYRYIGSLATLLSRHGLIAQAPSSSLSSSSSSSSVLKRSFSQLSSPPYTSNEAFVDQVKGAVCACAWDELTALVSSQTQTQQVEKGGKNKKQKINSSSSPSSSSRSFVTFVEFVSHLSRLMGVIQSNAQPKQAFPPNVLNEISQDFQNILINYKQISEAPVGAISSSVPTSPGSGQREGGEGQGVELTSQHFISIMQLPPVAQVLCPLVSGLIQAVQVFLGRPGSLPLRAVAFPGSELLEKLRAHGREMKVGHTNMVPGSFIASVYHESGVAFLLQLHNILLSSCYHHISSNSTLTSSANSIQNTVSLYQQRTSQVRYALQMSSGLSCASHAAGSESQELKWLLIASKLSLSLEQTSSSSPDSPDSPDKPDDPDSISESADTDVSVRYLLDPSHLPGPSSASSSLFPVLHRLVYTLVHSQAYVHAAILCQFLITPSPSAFTSSVASSASTPAPSSRDTPIPHHHHHQRGKQAHVKTSEESNNSIYNLNFNNISSKNGLNLALNLIKQSPGNNDTSLYCYFYNITILESLIYLHTKRSEKFKCEAAMYVIRNPMLNIYTDHGLRTVHVENLKREFIQRLFNDFVGHL